jgi:hypothetical protein
MTLFLYEIRLKEYLLGISLYYDAERDYPLTEKENNLIRKTAEKYNTEKEKEFNKGEDFYIYEYDKDEPEKIFSGPPGWTCLIPCLRLSVVYFGQNV